MRASTHVTNAHHSANVGRTLTQKPAQCGGGSLVCGSPSPSPVQLPPRIQGNTGGQCRGPDDHGHSGTHYASNPGRGEPGLVSQRQNESS